MNEQMQKIFFGTVFVVLVAVALLVASSPWFTGMIGLRANFASPIPDIEPQECPPEGCDSGCFLAGTQIQTSSGTVSIEELAAGDTILSFNEKKSVRANFAQAVAVIEDIECGPDGCDSGCFLPGTQINSPDGTVAIESLTVGKPVFSFNSDKVLRQSDVATVYQVVRPYYFVVKAGDREVSVTAEHPFLTEKGYVTAENLQVNDAVFILNAKSGQLEPQKIVSIEKINRPTVAYNLSVNNDHTFLANGFAVHNKGDGGPYCGDSSCNNGETVGSCPSDCPGSCGDSICNQYNDEYANTCAADCSAQCGDDYCTHSETGLSCPVDCPVTCGNGVCGSDETIASCAADCSVCGDRQCTGSETQVSCSRDCSTAIADNTTYCGDHLCNGNEDSAFCPTDCYATCGDRACTHNENQNTCPTDCALGCGNRVCESNLSENQISCPADCGSPEETVISQTNLLARDYSKPENKWSTNQVSSQLAQAGYTTNSETISASLQNFCLTRNVMTEQYYPSQSFVPQTRTAVYIHIQNCDLESEKVWKDLALVEQVDKQLAQNASEIKSAIPINIVKADPIVEFRLPFLEKTGATLIYYLPKEISAEQAALFSFPIINQFSESTLEEIAQLGCKSQTECSDNLCILGRCINKNCYQIPALNGTPCGFGQECVSKICTEKNLGRVNQPTNLIDAPAAILTIIVLLLGAWIVREYIKP